MEDDDLQRIRQARLQELQQRGQPSGGGGGGGDDKKLQEDETRKSLINQICTPEAVDRLGRIAMVKEERARDLENRLIMLARSNQLRQRVTEQELIQLIGMLDEKKDEQKIVFSRRKAVLDDDDDFGL